MIIEKSVADPELCSRLSGDEFLNSAYAWILCPENALSCGRLVDGKRMTLVNSTSSMVLSMRDKGELVFPAPNLSEILNALSELPQVFQPGIEKSFDGWKASCIVDPADALISGLWNDEVYSKLESKNHLSAAACDAALNLYFDVRSVPHVEIQ